MQRIGTQRNGHHANEKSRDKFGELFHNLLLKHQSFLTAIRKDNESRPSFKSRERLIFKTPCFHCAIVARNELRFKVR
jgi:hypothetical protein